LKGGEGFREVAWISSNPPGVELCIVARRRSGWVLQGSVLRRFKEGVGAISYRIDVDSGWKTKRAMVEQVLRGKRSVLEIKAGPSGWLLNDEKEESLRRCVDLDLEASPVTNTLPIKRVRLSKGEEVDLTSAWVRFPSLKVHPLRQSYEKLGKNRYRYASASGFSSEIDVDSFGLVRRYGESWLAV